MRLAAALCVAVLGCDAASPGKPSEAREAAVSAPPARTPERIRSEGNHLLGSGSAYLAQHSHNPVDWYPWGPEALALASRLDRPIFLSIGYVSCHWCHVMEKEVFEHDDVAVFLNEHFVSIKVDREERPDLDSVYMEAVQAMTGGGGWPMTALLTPSLRPFFGGTYFPHDRFLEVMLMGDQRFRTTRSDVENRGAEVHAAIAATEPAGRSGGFEPGEVRALAARALGEVDRSLGGFVGRTKFPTPIKWAFLLDAYRSWGDRDTGVAIRQTLDAMAAGGIHDQVAGGFFRYSTEPTWTVPHFEKMLYDNAQLAALYLRAAAAVDEPRYLAVGVSTLEFLLRDMKTGAGGFGASFDADTDGKEGATYLFTPGDLVAVAGTSDGSRLAALLGATPSGNFDGANVPTFRTFERPTPADLDLWRRWQPKLLEARNGRRQPMFDPKMVTAWNGLAVGALALGYRASGDERFLDASEHAVDALWQSNRLPAGDLARASNGGQPGAPAVLDDYAFLAAGLLDLFEASAKPVYLERATALATAAMSRFSDPSGAWFLTSGSEQEPLGRRIAVSDGVEPSGNASFISTLQRLASLTGRTEFRDAAQRALGRYAITIRQRGLEMAGWLDDALMAEKPFYELVVAGRDGPLKAAWNRLLPTWTVGVQVPPEGPDAALESAMPTAGGKHDRGGKPVAYVCVQGSCKAPTSDPLVLRSELLAGWAR